MSLQVQETKTISEMYPTNNITVIGVGGTGRTVINNMIHTNRMVAEFFVVETDAHSIKTSKAKHNVLLEMQSPQNLTGPFNDQTISDHAIDTLQSLKKQIGQSDTVIIVAGMGRYTGTNLAPEIAKIAHDMGVHTFCVVTLPFYSEGSYILSIAEKGIQDLHSSSDVVIALSNQNLFQISTENTSFEEASKISNKSLCACVQAFADLMSHSNTPGLNPSIVWATLKNNNGIFVGTGQANGERRALDAVELALTSPLVDHLSIGDAKSIFINITGHSDLSLFEIDEAMNRLRDDADEDAAILYGYTSIETTDSEIRVSIIATDTKLNASWKQPSL